MESTLVNSNAAIVAGGSSSSGSEMPIPELLTWILDKFKDNASTTATISSSSFSSISGLVEMAVIRFYGAVVHSYMQQKKTKISSGSIENETKKLFLVVSSSQGLKILIRIITQLYSRVLGSESISSITTSQQLSSVSKNVSSYFSTKQGEMAGLYASLVLLNKLLSLSEQAIATVKQLDSMSQLAHIITVMSDISVNLSSNSAGLLNGKYNGSNNSNDVNIIKPTTATGSSGAFAFSGSNANWEEVTAWLRHLLL